MVRNRAAVKISLVVFVFFLSLYMLIFRGEYYSMDEMARYGLTKTIVLEHDLSITSPEGTSFYSPYPLLQSVVAVPLFVLGQILAGDVRPAAQEVVARFVVSLFNPIITALCCMVFFGLARRVGFKNRTSLILTLVFGLCTIVLPYSRVFLSEPLTGLLIMCAALWALPSTRERPAGGVLATLFLALAATNNYVALPVIAALAFFFLFQDGGPKNALSLKPLKDLRLWGVLLFGVAAVAESLWYNHVRFGSYMRSAYSYFHIPGNTVYPDGMTGFSYPLLAGVYGFLFSPMRSIFLYSPPLLGALVLWPRFWKEHRRAASLFLAIALIFLSIYSKWFGWHGGYAWGPRYLVSITGFLLMPFGYLIEDFRKLRPIARLSVIVLCIAGILVQALPTLVHPAYSYVEVLKKYGGMPNELLILFLPQACSVVVQARLLGAITGPKDTDIYLLKHLDSGPHVLALLLGVAVVLVTGIMILRMLTRADEPNAEG
jgi:hypothetical protein